MAGFASRWARHVAWVSLWGPLLSLIPARWRGRKLDQLSGDWETSATISGVFEFALALELFWTWFDNRLQLATLLWVALYMAIDGAWRALAAHTAGEAHGTLLLAVVDEAAHALSGPRALFRRALTDKLTLMSRARNGNCELPAAVRSGIGSLAASCAWRPSGPVPTIGISGWRQRCFFRLAAPKGTPLGRRGDRSRRGPMSIC
jgi:hypothetical protein